MLKKNNNEEVNIKLATTTLLAKGKYTIPHILNFFQIVSTINSSTCLASSFNSKGTPNNLDNSPSFAHFQLKLLIQSTLGFIFFWQPQNARNFSQLISIPLMERNIYKKFKTFQRLFSCLFIEIVVSFSYYDKVCYFPLKQHEIPFMSPNCSTTFIIPFRTSPTRKNK